MAKVQLSLPPVNMKDDLMSNCKATEVKTICVDGQMAVLTTSVTVTYDGPVVTQQLLSASGEELDPTLIPCTDVEAATSNSTGLYDAATGQPVYSRVIYDNVADEIIRELFYYDPVTGDEIVTTTGFTPTTAPTDVETDLMYDTLTTGVVERITKDSVFVDGAFDSATYRDFADAAYTPAGIVADKPQKIQMGQEDLAVTGAGVAFAAVPTAANSQGQAFPQHALIHVHVDSASNAFGIAYTTDGTNPAEAHEFERSQGQPIELDTNEEIVGFRAAPLDAAGDIAVAETIQITVEYNNIDEDKDDI